MKKVSIIVPAYNEEPCLEIFDETMNGVICELPEYEFEIIYVDDGSKDGTHRVIKELSEKREYVRFISFSRNFGKEAAMYAGFKNATGDYVAVMDADLQDPPTLLPEMLKILESGEYDSVATRRVTRKGEPKIRSWFARRFYSLINRISEADIVDGARDYRLMKREMVDVLVEMGERNRFSKGLFGWIGFRTYWYEFENVERVAGETKWSFWKLFAYAIDGIINFSQAPLKIASWAGICSTVLSLIAIIFVIVRKMIFGDPVAGWASTVCIILFVGGIQLLCLGIIGQYLGKAYIETKKRPHYIASDRSDKKIKKIG